jgi:hypothetical protein
MQQGVKPSEGETDFFGLPRMGDGLEGASVIHEVDSTPESTLGIADVIFLLMADEDTGKLQTTRLVSGGLMTLDVIQDRPQVFHDPDGVGKYPVIDALQDHGTVRIADQGDPIRIVDESVAIRLHGQDLPAKIECGCYIVSLRFHGRLV